MTTAQWIAKQQKGLDAIKKGIPFGRALASTHPEVTNRIFRDGKDVSGTEVQAYNDTAPIYVNPKTQSPKDFATKGKTGKDTFGDGKKHITGYFASYKKFRGAIDRKTDKVYFDLFGTLKLDYLTGLKQISEGKWIVEVKTELSANKIEGQEERFGKVFTGITKEEKERLIEIIQKESLKFLA